MRFTAIASAALAAAPSVVSAAGAMGFALGTKKSDGSCKYQADYEADFDAIASASGSKLVRGYSASDCNCAQGILPAAKAKGFQVVLGVWPDVPESFNLDKGVLEKYVPQYPDQVYGITVGSEALYRGSLTAEALLSKMQDIKSSFPSIKVGTADSWNKYADGTANPIIQSKPDMLLVNAFAYWQAQDITNATATYFDDLMQAFETIQNVSGSVDGIELWNGETGWSGTGGTNYGDGRGLAVASDANANTFYHDGFCGILKWDVNAFYFEAFDEPWKPESIGDNGKASVETKWGAMTANRQPKFNLHC